MDRRIDLGQEQGSVENVLVFRHPRFKIVPEVLVGIIDIQFLADILPVGFDRPERNVQLVGNFLAC